jgi:hypothetical protein
MIITQRNFFRLLRAGTFDSEEEIEPMSGWKWRQVFVWGRKLGVNPLLYDGVQKCNGQFFMQLPADLDTLLRQECATAEQNYLELSVQVAELLSLQGQWQMRPVLLDSWVTGCLYPRPVHHYTGPVNIYFPFATQGQKADEWAKNNVGDDKWKEVNGKMLRYQWKNLNVEHRHRMFVLSNKLNNMTLQDIIKQEWLDGGTSHVVIDGQRIETVGPTLYMLMSLLSIFKETLNEGPALWQIVDIGILLRRQGDRVDFVKLQDWIEQLHFTRMTQLVGMVLIGLLGFSADEVPFTKVEGGAPKVENIANDLLSAGRGNNSKYLRYAPGESISNVVASLTHSLGNVEE